VDINVSEENIAYIFRVYVKLEAECSSETSVTIMKLHGVITQKTVI
jgi:hypothetical protein